MEDAPKTKLLLTLPTEARDRLEQLPPDELRELGILGFKRWEELTETEQTEWKRSMIADLEAANADAPGPQ